MLAGAASFPFALGSINQSSSVARGAFHECVSFQESEIITIESLKEKGMIPNDVQKVKVLANGKLDKPLIFSSGLLFSERAREKIQQAGGKIQSE